MRRSIEASAPSLRTSRCEHCGCASRITGQSKGLIEIPMLRKMEGGPIFNPSVVSGDRLST
jgi:hypothetical protein